MNYQERDWLRVTDLKEYGFCPRIIYYENCLPQLHPSTFKMVAGVQAHSHERKKATRRSLHAYDVPQGERHFDMLLISELLGLIGEIDEVVLVKGGAEEVFPVDYKLARKTRSYYKEQLAAYALLLEEKWQTTINRGYIYLIPLKKAETVIITTRMKNKVRRQIKEIREMIEAERMPPPTKIRSRCYDCKYRRFCNDV